MLKKRIALIVSITLIISMYCIFVKKEYTTYITEKIKKEQSIIKKIDNDYENFKKQIDNIVKKRTILYEESSSFFSYYESMKMDYEKVLKNYTEYEVFINKMDNDSKYLLDKCIDKDYSSLETVKQCYNFLNNYEQVINYYVKDVDLFNEKIINFNKWTVDKNNTLQQYTSKKYNKYIDINNDNKYIGKEED